GATQEPARKAVGEPARRAERLPLDAGAGDLELRPRSPAGGIGAGLEQRAGARDAPLVHLGSHRVIDLLEEHGPVTAGPALPEAELLELVGEAPQTPALARRHRRHRYSSTSASSPASRPSSMTRHTSVLDPSTSGKPY